MSNENWSSQLPWVPPSLAHRFPIPQSSWPHNPILQTFHHAAANNFGSVDLSMPNKNSNSIQTPVMGNPYILPPPMTTALPTTPPSTVGSPSVIHSTSSHNKVGKITPIDTKILTGERPDSNSSTKSPINCDIELNRIQSNESFAGSPQRRLLTPDNHMTPRTSTVPSEDSTDSVSTTKSRRKRKPNVTKKLTNDVELIDEKNDCEMMRMENDLRTDYSEKDMDIENDICSSERISEVCSPTTNLVIEKNLQMASHVTSPLPAPPVVPASPRTPTKVPDKEPVQKPTNNRIQQQDSDDCETIDKIAEMVSDLTGNKATEPTPSIVPESPQNNSTNFSLSENQSKILEEVETRLEEMFAEPEPGPSQNSAPPPPPISNQETPAALDKSETKPEEKIPAISMPNTPTSSTKKPVNRSRGKKEGAKRKKPANNGRGGKQNGKNGKNGNKINGNGKDFGKDLKTPAQKKEMNGKSSRKPENGLLGPILQIQKDGSFNVVNQTTNGDDDGEKSMNKIKKGITNLDKSKVIRGMHVSTLSNKYDADTKDMTWICVFCKLGSHKHELGDLFGPYIISKSDEEFQFSQEDPQEDIFRQGNENKLSKINRKGQPLPKSPEANEKLPKKKRKLTAQSPMKSPAPKVNGTTEPNIFAGMIKVDDNTFEVWVHEDCVVWASGVYIIGTKIVGLEAAIWTSTRHFCCFCSQNGAVLSCLHRGCNLEAHLCCAKSNKWKLDNEFKTVCEIHAT